MCNKMGSTVAVCMATPPTHGEKECHPIEEPEDNEPTHHEQEEFPMLPALMTREKSQGQRVICVGNLDVVCGRCHQFLTKKSSKTCWKFTLPSLYFSGSDVHPGATTSSNKWLSLNVLDCSLHGFSRCSSNIHHGHTQAKPTWAVCQQWHS